VLYVNAHAAERGGKRARRASSRPAHLAREDPTTSSTTRRHQRQDAQDHLREHAAQDQALLVNVQSRAGRRATGTATTARNYNYAGANFQSPRLPGRAGCTRPQRISPARLLGSRAARRRGGHQYLRLVREHELGGRPFAAANDQHGAAVGAVLLHDQGNDAAKVDRRSTTRAPRPARWTRSSRPTRPRPGSDPRRQAPRRPRPACATSCSSSTTASPASRSPRRPLPDASSGRVRHRSGSTSTTT